VFVEMQYSAMARDWVCRGVSEAIEQEAQEKRERAAERIAQQYVGGQPKTREFIAQVVQELGLSKAAEEHVFTSVQAIEGGRTLAQPGPHAQQVAEITANLEMIYDAYCPNKKGNIPGLLDRYKGKEDRLLRKAMEKYRISSMASVKMSLERKQKGKPWEGKVHNK
jgi:hypothetical protein